MTGCYQLHPLQKLLLQQTPPALQQGFGLYVKTVYFPCLADPTGEESRVMTVADRCVDRAITVSQYLCDSFLSLID